MLFANTENLPLTVPIYLSSVLAIGIFAQWLAWRIHIPAIVLLLGLGVGLGRFAPPGQYIESSLLFPLVSLSVAIILFEGGLSLRFREIKETGRVVFGLVTIGLLVTGVMTTFAAIWILGFSTPMAILCGTLLTVSGPTVVIPILRQIRPNKRVGAISKWEGIVNDPIGAVLAALVFEIIISGHFESFAGEAFFAIGKTLLIGAVLGGFSAWFIVFLFKKHLVPDYLQNAVVLAIVLLMFTISNHLQHESGLLTVTLLGIVLANQRKVSMRSVIEFKENLRVLLISALFIVLAARVQINTGALESMGWSWSDLLLRGGAFLAVLMLIIRPIAVLLSTMVGKTSWQEKAFLAWIHPRGIVAAAVASLFALEMANSSPVSKFSNEAEQLVMITFLVIIGTVTIYGLSLSTLAKKLKISSHDPQGILFAGATKIVREIALELKEDGFETLLVDTNASNIAEARMAGLPTVFANIVSEYALHETNLGELGKMLAMTSNNQINALASMQFIEHFGKANVYQLAIPEASHEKRETIPADRHGRFLFEKDVTFDRLASRIGRGSVMKTSSLTEDYTYEDFQERYSNDAVLLFVITESSQLLVATPDNPLAPTAGQKIVALVDETT